MCPRGHPADKTHRFSTTQTPTPSPRRKPWFIIAVVVTVVLGFGGMALSSRLTSPSSSYSGGWVGPPITVTLSNQADNTSQIQAREAVNGWLDYLLEVGAKVGKPVMLKTLGKDTEASRVTDIVLEGYRTYWDVMKHPGDYNWNAPINSADPTGAILGRRTLDDYAWFQTYTTTEEHYPAPGTASVYDFSTTPPPPFSHSPGTFTPVP